jgi:dolichyl-phosphate-mannose--protein O-mannosyl transferase
MNSTDPNSCPYRRNNWSDCGTAGITEKQCTEKGCCWDPKSDRAWCYHKGVIERPKLSWWYQIKETLRATWANNGGEALNVHPSMSEWREWPFMLHRAVPFGSTKEGGRLKAFGNPGVYWPVAFTVIACTLGVLAWFGRIIKWVLFPERPLALPAPAASDDKAMCPPPRPSPLFAAATAVNSIGGGGWVIPFVTLLFGYYINLVPYELIVRSKFAYHYIPALIVGMMFTVFTADVLWRASDLPCTGNGFVAKYRKHISRGFVYAIFAFALLGFYYWALPYAYGVPLTLKQHRERMWVHAWANEDNWIFPKQK